MDDSHVNLLNADGSPKGISFRRHKSNPSSYILRIKGKGLESDLGANAECFAECYEKAIDRRLGYLGLEDDAEAFQTLASAYGAFLTRYGIELVPVTYLEFKITKGN